MSITLHGAVIQEQGVTFAVVVTKKHVVDSSLDADRFIGSCRRLFPGVPIVLAAQDYRGRFTYYGRQDISKFLASISPGRIPWKEYTFSE